MKKIKTLNSKKSLILSRELILNTRHGLSPEAFKLLMIFVRHLDIENSLFPNFEIAIKDCFKYLGLKEDNGKRYEIVRDAFIEIAKNPLEYKKSPTKWGIVAWITYATFDKDKSENLKFGFSDAVKPYLLAFKEAFKLPRFEAEGYTKLATKDYIKFDSKYSVALYPIFLTWLKQNKKLQYIEKLVDIEYLKEVTFTEEDYKGRIDNWLRYVINTAIKEINEKSNITVLEIRRDNKNIHKHGRKYAFIDFNLKWKKKAEYLKFMKIKENKIKEKKKNKLITKIDNLEELKLLGYKIINIADYREGLTVSGMDKEEFFKKNRIEKFQFKNEIIYAKIIKN